MNRYKAQLVASLAGAVARIRRRQRATLTGYGLWPEGESRLRHCDRPALQAIFLEAPTHILEALARDIDAPLPPLADAESDNDGLGPWTTDGAHLFISHEPAERQAAAQFADELRVFGCEAFLARPTGRVSYKRAGVNLEAIATCDALVCFFPHWEAHTPWIDQEIGLALARNLPVLCLGGRTNSRGRAYMAVSRAVFFVWSESAVADVQVFSRAFDRFPALREKRDAEIVRAFCSFESQQAARRLVRSLRLVTWTPELRAQLDVATREKLDPGDIWGTMQRARRFARLPKLSAD